MEIQLISTRQHQDDQTVYFTLTDDSLNDYLWHTDIPQGLDVQACLEANIEKYLLGIRRKEYPGAIYEISEYQTELEAIEAWITAGHTNPDLTIIDKVDFVGTHPNIYQESDQTERDNLLNDAKNFAENWTYQEVNDWVEANFSDHTNAQRTFLKKAGRAILYLLKAKE